MILATSLSAVLLAATPSVGEAAKPAEPLVSSGVSVGAGAGSYAMFKAGASSSWGYGVAVEARYAPIERLAIGLSVVASSWRLGTGGGDAVALTPMASLRVNAISVSDRWGIRRLWVFMKAGAGYSIGWPRSSAASAGLLVFGTLGLEYRTHLRHFSLGLEATPSYSPSAGAVGLLITPTLQFAF